MNNIKKLIYQSFVLEKKIFIKVLLFSFMSAVLVILQNILIGDMMRNVIDATNELFGVEIIKYSVRIFAVIGMVFVLKNISVFFQLVSATKYTNKLSEMMHEVLLKKSINLVTHSGKYLSLFTNDIQLLNRFFSMEFKQLMQIFFGGLGSLFIVILIDYRLGIVILLFGLLNYFINGYFTKQGYSKGAEVQENLEKLTIKYSDFLQGLNTIRLFNLKRWVNDSFEVENVVQKITEVELVKVQTQSLTISELVTLFNRVTMFGLGSYLVLKNQLSVGSFLAIIFHSKFIFALFTNFNNWLVSAQRSYVAHERIETFIRSKIDKIEEIQLEMEEKPIVIRNLEFSYTNNLIENEILFRGLELSIEKIGVYVIKGKTGAGKSTLFKILMGYVDINNLKGEILIYGNEINKINGAGLRNHMSYMNQNTNLFSGTIEENIKLANQNCSTEAFKEACEISGVNEFINKLPNGLQTYITEMQIPLSFGEKQRISLARTIIKDSKIVLLDEPTSSLDSVTEAKIVSTVEHLSKNKVVLVVSHSHMFDSIAEKLIYI